MSKGLKRNAVGNALALEVTELADFDRARLLGAAGDSNRCWSEAGLAGR